MQIDPSYLKIAIVNALLMGGIASFAAYKKRQNPYIWFFVGFFFGMLGLLTIFFMPSFRTKKIKKAANTETITAPEQKNEFFVYWYYLNNENVTTGPLSFEGVKKLFSQGKILETTYVWNESMDSWKQLKELKEHSLLNLPASLNDTGN